MLLRKLATNRMTTEQLPVRYDEDEQVSYVLEGGAWKASYDSTGGGMTKKCDIETGEDQKGQ